ncbi:putative phage tail protein [Saccharibacter floricola]|uniref:DUF2313 domain-containing protein n=1 Tax=Saccharibacter floricola DSM 15669 TaxID=1123227 RepID=A0ABQ0P1C3_9PROT|nr:putative phage tail protein [Saccharibacter floricola]GBQ08961.1 hypothetical protein AA15669_1986 [Saccharibacter floricola DSM 15669]
MTVMNAPRSAPEIARQWREELMPRGSALGGPNISALMAALADPRETLEGNIASVCREICPADAQALLAGYRDLLGPDPLGRDEGALSETEWRTILQQRWTARGDQRSAFYVALAKDWGIDITIEEPDPPICGAVSCGASECGNEALRFIWVVHLPSGITQAICGVAVCGTVEAAQNDSNHYAKLQAVFRALKPADTEVYFIHEGDWING